MVGRLTGPPPSHSSTGAAMNTASLAGCSFMAHMAAGFVPKNYHPSIVSEVRTVTDDEAWRTKVLLAKQSHSMAA